MKALSIRLDDRLGKQFDNICRETGYKKNTLVTRFIAAFVDKHRKGRSRRHLPLHSLDDVIGIINEFPLIETDDAIDRVVYEL